MTISLLKYFSWKKTTSITKEILPDPSGSLSKEVPSSTIAAANEIAVNVLTASKKKKEYIKLTDAQRLQIGKKASKIGITATIRFYNDRVPDLGRLLMEPTVRRLKHRYNDELRKYNEELRKRPQDTDPDQDPGELLELPLKKRGGHFYSEKT